MDLNVQPMLEPEPISADINALPEMLLVNVPPPAGDPSNQYGSNRKPLIFNFGSEGSSEKTFQDQST